MSDDMRGLFFVVKGQYAKGVKPSFVNRVTNEVSFIGGYDPYNKDTAEWYMLLDCKTFNCVCCGTNLNKVLKGVYNNIIKYKGVAKNYFKHVSSTTSDDYYETHYLGRRPLTHEERVNKAEGRCPRVSPIMREMYKHIYEEFGDFFSEEVEKMEDLAYSDLVVETPLKKAKKRYKKVMTETPKTPKREVEETPTLKKVKPKRNKVFKKLSME